MEGSGSAQVQVLLLVADARSTLDSGEKEAPQIAG
jgi:hypothetical protein